MKELLENIENQLGQKLIFDESVRVIKPTTDNFRCDEEKIAASIIDFIFITTNRRGVVLFSNNDTRNQKLLVEECISNTSFCFEKMLEFYQTYNFSTKYSLEKIMKYTKEYLLKHINTIYK